MHGQKNLFDYNYTSSSRVTLSPPAPAMPVEARSSDVSQSIMQPSRFNFNPPMQQEPMTGVISGAMGMSSPHPGPTKPSNIDDVMNGIRGLQMQFGTFQNQLTAMQNQYTNLSTEFSMMKDVNENLVKENVGLKKALSDVQQNQEVHYRLISSNNIIINGVQQTLVDEPPQKTEEKVLALFRDTLQLPAEDIDISTTFRLKNAKSKHKPILVKLVHESDKSKIFEAARVNLDSTSGISIKGDRSKRTREIRGVLSKFFSEFKEAKKEVKMVDDYLVVDGIKHVYDQATDAMVPVAIPPPIKS